LGSISRRESTTLLIVAGSPNYHPVAKAKIATLVFDCLRPMTLRTDIDDFTANRVPVVIGAMQRERSASAGFELHVGKNVARAALVALERLSGRPVAGGPQQILIATSGVLRACSCGVRQAAHS
jgi:hypothetical protein